MNKIGLFLCLFLLSGCVSITGPRPKIANDWPFGASTHASLEIMEKDAKKEGKPAYVQIFRGQPFDTFSTQNWDPEYDGKIWFKKSPQNDLVYGVVFELTKVGKNPPDSRPGKNSYIYSRATLKQIDKQQHAVWEIFPECANPVKDNDTDKCPENDTEEKAWAALFAAPNSIEGDKGYLEFIVILK